MIANNLKILQRARKEGWAVPAINTQGGNYDIIWAVCKAAQDLRSPIILAHYAATGEFSGNDWFAEVAKWCAGKVDIPVSIHLDHADSLELCREALRLGFTSVMIDGSSLPVAENARLTQSVIEEAKVYGVPVEAEIGELQRLVDGAAMENKNIADIEQVRAFLSFCQPDTLAIGIGNAHGYYTGKPDIRLDVLKKAVEFCTLPFVLHGCTGMAEDIIRASIKYGIAKINFGTEIRFKYVEYYSRGINTLDHQGHSWKLSQYACEELQKDIQNIIRLSGSDGKAS